MTPLQATIAYNQAGRVGSSSIYTATIASHMAETSQNTYRRPLPPAAIIHIDLERLRQV